MALPSQIRRRSAANTTAITVNGTPDAGNLLIAGCAFGRDNTAPTPAGWTLIDNYSVTGANSARSRRIIGKIADGTETGTLVNFGGTSTRPAVWYVEIQDADIASAADIASKIQVFETNTPSGSVSTLTVSGTADADDTFLLGMATTRGTTTTQAQFGVNSPASQVMERQASNSPVNWVIANISEDTTNYSNGDAVSMSWFENGSGTAKKAAAVLLTIPGVSSGTPVEVPLGTATENEQANPITIASEQGLPLGIATENEQANELGIFTEQVLNLNVATEAEQALPITFGSSIAINLGTAVETEQALSLQILIEAGLILGIATEIEQALPLAILAEQSIGLGIATENESALPITFGNVVVLQLNTTVENEQALPINFIVTTVGALRILLSNTWISGTIYVKVGSQFVQATPYVLSQGNWIQAA